MIDPKILAIVGQQLGIPPAILYGLSMQSNLPGSDALAGNYGFDAAAVSNDPMQQALLMGTALKDMYTRYGNWSSAISAYASGDPTAYQSPTSPIGGIVTGTMAVASANATLGLNGDFANNPLAGQMFSDLGAQIDSFASQGGVITPQSAQAYHEQTNALQHGSVGGPGQLAQGLSVAGRNNAQSYTAGQCTYYVARSLGFIPNGLGNAGDWASRAEHMGMTIGHAPAVGTAVVYAPGGGYSPQYGHVAVVTGVNPDGTFMVSEMNYNGAGVVDTRKSTMADVIGFIQPPAGTDMSQVAPGLASELGQTPSAPSPKSAPAAQKPAEHQVDPDAGGVNDFAMRAKALALSPNDFQNVGKYATMMRRYGLQPSDMENFAQTKGMTDPQLQEHAASQNHPLYPEIPAGVFNRVKETADMYSMLHLSRTTNPPEVLRLVKANASNADIQSYFKQQAKATSGSLSGETNAEADSENVLPMKRGALA